MKTEVEEISRDEVKGMLDSGEDVTIIEVLDKDAYSEFHLPEAINVPLGPEFGDAIQQMVADKSQPVVVYCWDEACTASPAAAKRMAQLGYSRVYDYAAGKKDWKDAGLPVETGGR